MNILQLLMSNPQQVINNVIGRNPMAGNLMNMVNSNDKKGIEEMARNLAKEKGQDPDKLFNDIKSKLNV
ncbi:MAG: hypothetical protein J6T10_22765 [Methanobrevibacter sp.]|nr:hypothetical protein [Methanobrevibacter sp.]